MKKYLFYLAIVFVFSIKVNAQNYYLFKNLKKDNSSTTIFYEVDDARKDSNVYNPLQIGFGSGDFNGQIYSELVADYFTTKANKYLGHISIGSVLTNSKSDSSITINNFFNGGGNLFLKYAFVTPFGEKDGRDNFTFLNIFSFRPSANLPKLKSGNSALDTWNLEIADEFTISLMSKNEKIGILLKPKVGWAFGSKSFLNTILTVDSKSSNPKLAKSFGYFQFNSAIHIAKKYIVNMTFEPKIHGILNPTFINRKWTTIGVQLLM